MAYFLGGAKKDGINEDEIGAVQAIVMAVSAGRINAQFREARSSENMPIMKKHRNFGAGETR